MHFKNIPFFLAIFYSLQLTASYADQINPYQTHHLRDAEKVFMQFFTVPKYNLLENPIEIQSKDIPLILNELNRNIEYTPGVACDCLGDGKMFFMLKDGSKVESRLKHENLLEFNFGKRNNEFLELSEEFRRIILPYYPKQEATPMLVCPTCGEKANVIRIVYGLPNLCLLNDDRAEKVLLGGCLISENDPKYYCKTCGNKF